MKYKIEYTFVSSLSLTRGWNFRQGHIIPWDVAPLLFVNRNCDSCVLVIIIVC